MKRTNILLSSLILFSLFQILHAQDNKSLKLYAIMGLQNNAFENNFGTDTNLDFNSFSIGAGSSYHFGRFQLGTEFYSSNGNSSNNGYKNQYIGFSSTIYAGYDILKSDYWALEPSLGFNMSNNQIISHDKTNLISTHFNNNQFGVSTALSLSKFSESGLFWGLKLGYNSSLSDDFWKNGINDADTDSKERINSFFVQLHIGGRINLTRKSKMKNSNKKTTLLKSKLSNAVDSPIEFKSEVDDFLIKEIEKHRTPSVQYIFFNKDSVLHKSKFGFVDVENKTKPSDKSTYHAFSITKTFTALSILQLAEKGKLNIIEPVGKYLPNFPYDESITIKQLLAHTGGIPNPIPLNWIHLTNEHESFNRDAFFAKQFEKHHNTKSKPNDKFRYSNLGYVILGELIEKISEMPYEEYINKYILEPINVASEELSFKVDNAHQAKGYHKKNSFSNILLGLFIDKPKFMVKPEGKWKPFNNYYVNGAPYGGLIGTPNALMKYAQELLKPSSKIISNEYKEMLFTENLTNKGKETGMCLSWFKGELNGNQFYAHAGGGGGYYCEIRLYPKLEMGSVIMFNRTGMKDERFLNKLDKYFIN